MKILYKLTLGFIFISILVGFEAFIGYNGAVLIQQRSDQITDETMPVLENLNIIQDAGLNIIHATNEILYTSPDYQNHIDLEINEIEEYSKTYERSFEIYENKVNTYFPEEKEHLYSIRSSLENIIRVSSELTYLKKNSANASQIKEKGMEFDKYKIEFLTEIELALEQEKIELKERTEQTEKDMNELKKNSMIFGLFSFIMALSLGFFMSNRLSTPIEKLKNASHEIGNGNLDTKIEINSKDELEELGNSFSQMTENLKNSLNETTNAKNFSNNIIESMVDMLIVLNPDLTIKTVNIALLHILNYQENELTGKNIELIVPEKDFIEQFIKEKTDGIKSILIRELNFKRKNGEIIPVSFSASILNDTGGNFEGIVCMGKDITEQKITTDKIKASLAEKEVLLREIHHRVKNNMQIISSLLMLASQNIDDEKYINIFNDSNNRIHSMALIHEKLYLSGNIEKIEIKDYIDDLASDLLVSYGGKGNVKLELNVEKIPLDINYAVPCGLIINELITNSLKYAFPEGRKGNIKIIFKSIEENMICFSVRDDGVGIPGDLDIRNTKSLGLHLVHALTENQLHGQINIIRENGIEFQIKFRDMR